MFFYLPLYLQKTREIQEEDAFKSNICFWQLDFAHDEHMAIVSNNQREK
jgi:hypothetical protein